VIIKKHKQESRPIVFGLAQRYFPQPAPNPYNAKDPWPNVPVPVIATLSVN